MFHHPVSFERSTWSLGLLQNYCTKHLTLISWVACHWFLPNPISYFFFLFYNFYHTSFSCYCSLSILTQILPTDCLWSKAVQRPEQSYEAKCQPLLKCLVWFICSLRLPLYPKYAFDRNNAVTLNHVSRSKWINVKADLFQNQFCTLSPWPNLAQRSMSNSNSLQRSMSNSNF